MSDAPLVAVDIPCIGDPRHKNWAKVVHSVDPQKSSGWTFEGDFIAVGGIQDVAAGSVLVVYGERGSRGNPQVEARVFVVNPDATLSEHATAKGRAWARTLRDQVDRLLDSDRPIQLDWQPELGTFTAEALADELARRGWTVQPPPAG
jgi:hypothetical protein